MRYLEDLMEERKNEKMIPKKHRKIFSKMRKLKIRDDMIIQVPQPGLFREKTIILCIGQNPEIPKPDLLESDKVLMTKGIDDDTLHAAYEDLQRNLYFYDFITNFTKWDNISILNVCHFPTNNNTIPSLKAIESCRNLLKEAIESIDPKVILVVGKLAQQQLKKLNLEYKIIKSPHYSYLRRQGNAVYEKEIKRIKEELQYNLEKWVM